MKLVVAIVFLTISVSVNAQKLLFQKRSYRTAIYSIGDDISLRIKGERFKIAGQIIGFEDSLIVLHGLKINPKDVSHLYVDEKTITWFVLRYKYSRIFLYGGAGYLFLDVFNHGEVREETLLIGGALISAGLLARKFIPNTIKIKGRRKLVILKG